MEFKAEVINGELLVKPIVEGNGTNNVVLHMPSFQEIERVKKEHIEKEAKK